MRVRGFWCAFDVHRCYGEFLGISRVYCAVLDKKKCPKLWPKSANFRLCTQPTHVDVMFDRNLRNLRPPPPPTRKHTHNSYLNLNLQPNCLNILVVNSLGTTDRLRSSDFTTSLTAQEWRFRKRMCCFMTEIICWFELSPRIDSSLYDETLDVVWWSIELFGV
jgi:hypothetical protein